MKQTAVEWLVESLSIHFTFEQQMQFEGLFQQAKEMEEQQIIDAYKEGMGNVDGWIVNKNGVEEYYDEQFKKK